MNFGTGFRQWINLLYDRQLAKVLIDGQESENLPIMRGVHQGGPTSPLLFNIVIEMLAIAVSSKKTILGIAT